MLSMNSFTCANRARRVNVVEVFMGKVEYDGSRIALGEIVHEVV